MYYHPVEGLVVLVCSSGLWWVAAFLSFSLFIRRKNGILWLHHSFSCFDEVGVLLAVACGWAAAIFICISFDTLIPSRFSDAKLLAALFHGDFAFLLLF